MKNNKLKIVLISIIVGGILCGSIAWYILTKTSGENIIKNVFKPKTKINIVKNEASTITYETFDNGLISLKIPKGWKVDVPTLDYIHYSFKVYNPKDPNYMFLFGMKLEGFNKSQQAKDWQKKYYPDLVFAKVPIIDPQTTEAFYKVWNETADYVNSVDVKYNYLPKLNDFTVLENLGANPLGGDILRATFTNDQTKNQGLFTASVKAIGTYYVNSNVLNLFSEKIDVSPLTVYNIIFMSAPDSDFNDWHGILDNCLSTLKFSDTFVNGFNKEEQSIMSNFKANQAVYDSISDGI
ncbi:hypothetical protein IKE96_00735, partial [bacterium]|nr:hypothetical protein [bacterium]